MLNKLKDIGGKVQTGIDAAANQSNKMITSARGIPTSKDDAFEVERKKFNGYLSTMEKMYESIKKHTSGTKHMTEGLYSYSQNIAFFSGDEKKIPGSSDFVTNCENFKESAEAYRIAVTEVEINLKQKIEYLNMLKREINERDRLLLEYDKVKHELNVENKKPTPNPTAVNLIQTRISAAKLLYEKRNEDVLNQIKEAYNSRDVQSEFLGLVKGLGTFLTSGSKFVELGKKGASLPPPLTNTTIWGTPQSTTLTKSTTSSKSVPEPQTMQAKALPMPPPRPQQIMRCRALYSFNAQNPTELSLRAGDIIVINNNSHPAWWTGSCNGATGDFPSNYVELLP
eukprot:TRINITY_DN8913_c0_g1_i1.p1 TRINITY_DN8913_c0_g1~~TRINITY_DN8913_c0_g1_i1.p1  ORF type:complete len:340 (-),score=59.03 TRINITY_DN8913_c0_g1_i1:105-1124(-)